ncbi:unnamed protein product [Gongylonema pulchrum]|uniref:Phage protein n=1 Tax=Gongylonema pulchrum TaxID=637853 RepID=A0A183EEK7_9BILA|nr:unnamed protein product [Gongylonema pulchrum]
MERKYLRPNERCPVPLNEDFFKEIIGGDSEGRQQSADTAHRIDEMYASNVAAEVAPSAVNIVGNQYENLISLSFDQDELIRQEENRRRQMRERIVNAALRK